MNVCYAVYDFSQYISSNILNIVGFEVPFKNALISDSPHVPYGNKSENYF